MLSFDGLRNMVWPSTSLKIDDEPITLANGMVFAISSGVLGQLCFLRFNKISFSDSFAITSIKFTNN